MYSSLSNIQKHLYSLIKQNNPEYLQQSINEDLGVVEVKKEDKKEEKWDWRKHSREENKAQGLKVQQERDMQGRVVAPKVRGGTRPKAVNYYSTISKVSGSPLKHAEVAQNKTFRNLVKGDDLDANDLFYLQYQKKLSPEAIEKNHKTYGGSQKSYNLPKPTSTDPYADPKLFDVSDKKISSMYGVTYRDFEKATGERYDARNPTHQKSFFDLNSSPDYVNNYWKIDPKDYEESDNSDKQTLDLTGKSVNSKVSRIA
jgi:hypothetical protein